jgi:hypothetical protein
MPLSAFAGTYSDPAYGSFTLCAPSSASEACQAVLDTFQTTSNATGKTNEEALYASWPRLWGTHLRVLRTSSDSTSVKWTFSPTALFPSGFGADTTPFELPMDQDALAEFGLDEDGKVIGLGVVSEGLTDVERVRKGENAEERAEVWFSRVDT